ncbi:SPOSA6832_03729, partial [Sporobolomyces salmonicolor]
MKALTEPKYKDGPSVTLADTLNTLKALLSDFASQTTPVVQHYLAQAQAQGANAVTFVQHSDHPAAKALVSAVGHPRVQAFYAKSTHLALQHLPLLISTVALVLHLWISQVAYRRTERRIEQRRLQQTEDMVDYGLGSAASAAGGFGAGLSRKKDDHGLVEVQWGREKLRVPLPPPQSPLSALKSTLYNITGVPPDHQKLIYSGAVLKDDLAPLTAYQLVDEASASSADASSSESPKPKSFWDSWSFTGRSGADKKKFKKLIMLGSKDVSARVDDRLSTRKDLADLAAAEAAASAAAPGSKPVDDEPAVSKRIADISTAQLAELEPQVENAEAYLAQEQQRKQGGSAPVASNVEAPPPRTLPYLSEVLLQGLLKLDSIEIPSSYTEARKERKEAVKRVQSVLDRVDAAKELWKGLGLA